MLIVEIRLHSLGFLLLVNVEQNKVKNFALCLWRQLAIMSIIIGWACMSHVSKLCYITSRTNLPFANFAIPS